MYLQQVISRKTHTKNYFFAGVLNQSRNRIHTKMSWIRNTGENSAGSCYTSMLQIEPHSNGPLFVELHALLRIRREEQQLATWQPNNPSKPSGTASVVGGSAPLDPDPGGHKMAAQQPQQTIRYS
jgi:hypothetical protein